MSKGNPRRPKSTHWERSTSLRGESAKQEKRISKRLGARLTPNSGAGFHKSDASTSEFRIEMKQTKAKKMPVDRAVLAKIWREATETNLLPAVAVTMKGMDAPVPEDWVIITLETFEFLSGNT